jgi:hypothetical protein
LALKEEIGMKIWLILVLLLLGSIASAEQEAFSTGQYDVAFDMGDVGFYTTNITEKDSRFYAKITSENNSAVIIGYETTAADMNIAEENVLDFLTQAGINDTDVSLYKRTIDDQMAIFAVAPRADGLPVFLASYPEYLGAYGTAFYVVVFSNFPWEEGTRNLLDTLQVDYEPLDNIELQDNISDYGTPYSITISDEDESSEEKELSKGDSSENLTYKGYITFSNNNGESIDDAIIILNAQTDSEGVEAEYHYLEKRFGKKGTDWSLDQQSLVNEDGAYYDAMDITLSDGRTLNIYFDITDFFGKF